jgi:hypothetical protein
MISSFSSLLVIHSTIRAPCTLCTFYPTTLSLDHSSPSFFWKPMVVATLLSPLCLARPTSGCPSLYESPSTPNTTTTLPLTNTAPATPYRCHARRHGYIHATHLTPSLLATKECTADESSTNTTADICTSRAASLHSHDRPC